LSTTRRDAAPPSSLSSRTGGSFSSGSTARQWERRYWSSGGRDGEESLTETAKRELLEETGYRAERLTFLCRARTAVAWCDEYTEVYLAEDLQKTPSRHLDEAEDIRMEIHTKEELLAMIAEGTLSDAKTIAGIALYCAKQSKTE